MNWTAAYDGQGRRLQTVAGSVTNGVPSTTNVIVQYYDPQVEFGDVAVSVNGVRTWKVMGPDLNGRYGGLQGVGGLEATMRESDGTIVAVVTDHSGNVPVTINSLTFSLNWSPVRVGGYGPVLGYEAPALSPSVPLAETTVWRTRTIDPTGFYWLGARYYDPVAGRFRSPDPLGHAACMDLYSFCGGDPLNRFDPDGRMSARSTQVGQFNPPPTLQLGLAAGTPSPIQPWLQSQGDNAVSFGQGLLDPGTRGQTVIDYLYGSTSTTFNWFVQNAGGINSMQPGGQLTGYLNNQILNYLPYQGDQIINNAGAEIGANPASPSAQWGGSWAWGALTIGSLLLGEGEGAAAGDAERALVEAEACVCRKSI